MKRIFYTFIILCVALVNIARAEDWSVPSWQGMLGEDSDVIALVEFMSDGSYEAKGKVLKIYKGDLKLHDIIWVSGFSSQDGYISNEVKTGERYLVFVRTGTPNLVVRQQRTRLKENSTFDEAVKQNWVYYVQAPTAGFLRIKDKKVQYDMMSTVFYEKQKFYPLKEFDRFLKNALQAKPQKSFVKYLLRKVQKTKDSLRLSYYLTMLRLIKYKQYHRFYSRFLDYDHSDVQVAMAKLLGNCKESKEIVGPLLLEKLKGKNEEIHCYNIEDTVSKSVNRFRMEMIRALAKIDYEPAATALLPLLDTKNDFFFGLMYRALSSMTSKKYISKINKILAGNQPKLADDICLIVYFDSIAACAPGVMAYIDKHKNDKEADINYAIKALGKFKTKSVHRFLQKNFKELLQAHGISSDFSDRRVSWAREYLGVFTENKLDIGKSKGKLYDFLYALFGLSHQFKNYPELFAIKKQKEDSLAKLAMKVLKNTMVTDIESRVWLRIDSGKVVQVENFVLGYCLDRKRFGKLSAEAQKSVYDSLNQKLHNNGIALKHLTANEAKDFERSWSNYIVDYLCLFPNKKDLVFFDNLLKYGYITNDYDRKEFAEKIARAKKSLKK